jgi:hypothetical protein
MPSLPYIAYHVGSIYIPFDCSASVSSIKRIVFTTSSSTKSSINIFLSINMKFTSILFALVASLFLIDATLAIPAPRCRWLCRKAKQAAAAVKKIDVKNVISTVKGVVTKAKALASHPMVKTALKATLGVAAAATGTGLAFKAAQAALKAKAMADTAAKSTNGMRALGLVKHI